MYLTFIFWSNASSKSENKTCIHVNVRCMPAPLFIKPISHSAFTVKVSPWGGLKNSVWSPCGMFL